MKTVSMTLLRCCMKNLMRKAPTSFLDMQKLNHCPDMLSLKMITIWNLPLSMIITCKVLTM